MPECRRACGPRWPTDGTRPPFPSNWPFGQFKRSSRRGGSTSPLIQPGLEDVFVCSGVAGLKKDGGAWRPFGSIRVKVDSFHSVFVPNVYWQWRSRLWGNPFFK
eukprot:Gb_31435 [translate_table: standard]